MSDAAAAPAAPATNGTNGAQGHAAPVTPRPVAAQPTGPQTPAQPGARGPDGKFLPTKAPEPKPADDDPEYDLGDGTKLKRSALKSELGRARQASKLLTEAKKEREEAAKLRAEQDERKKRYREDPDSFFKDLEADDDFALTWASRVINEKHIKPSQMTAEQKALAERDAKIAAYEAKEKEAASAKEKAEVEQVTQAEEKKLRQQIGSILKAGGIPARPLAVKRVAERLAMYEEQEMDVPVEEAARLVRDEMAGDTADLLSSASMDELSALWGQEKFAGIVERLVTSKGVDGLRAAIGPGPFKKIALMFAEWGAGQLRGTQGQQRTTAVTTPQPKPSEFISPAEWELRRRNGSK